MKRTRRLEVTVEIDRPVVPHGNEEIWCSGCQVSVRTIGLDEAALLVGATSRELLRWVDQKAVHSVENSQGLMRICLNSLIWISTQSRLTNIS